MARHNQLEINVMHSFKNVKRDITNVQQQLIDLAKKQEEILEIVKTPSRSTTRTIVKTIKQQAKHKNKHYVAAKEGKKFHILDCPFAQNIHPKSKLIFKTKDAALNQGLKPCKCVK